MPSSRQLASLVPVLGQSGIRGDAGGNPPAAHQRFQDTDAACRAERRAIEFMYIHPAVIAHVHTWATRVDLRLA